MAYVNKSTTHPQTINSKWSVRIENTSYFFETKSEAESFIHNRKGDFQLSVKGKGRWVKKRAGYLL